MAATAVTVARATIAGVNDPTPVGADTVNGNAVSNVDGLVLTLENTDASPHTVTFTTPATHSGYAVADLPVVLAASAKKNFANFPAEAFSRTINFSTDSALVMISAIAPAS